VLRTPVSGLTFGHFAGATLKGDCDEVIDKHAAADTVRTADSAGHQVSAIEDQ
jgi:hypothetical protein